MVHGGRMTVATAPSKDINWPAAGLVRARRLDSNVRKPNSRTRSLNVTRSFRGILPLVAHRAAIDQYAHAFLVETGPVLGIAMPQFHRRPKAAAVLVFTVLLRHRVVEVDVQAQQTPRFVVAVGELAVLGRRTDVAFAAEMRAHGASCRVVGWIETPCPWWTRRR